MLMRYQLNAAREKFRADFHRNWNDLGIDVLICPANPQVAPQMDTSKYWK
jgi:Asp-tRNA(Asn)/Glu-tRNA(Gln) amidotransferase A subunit family amidase